MRKRVPLSYQKFNKQTKSYDDPQSMQIKTGHCGCSLDVADPQCRNARNWVIDWVDGKAVTLKECPKRFDDWELWESVHLAVYLLKDISNSLSFYGIPVSHITEPAYSLLLEIFAAKDRYLAQRAHMEAL